MRGALISIPKHQYESGAALGMTRSQIYFYIIIPADPAASDPAVDQPGHPYDQDDKPCDDDRCGGGAKGDTADHRGKPYGIAECGVRTVRNRVCTVFPGMLADQYAGGTSGKEME